MFQKFFLIFIFCISCFSTAEMNAADNNKAGVSYLDQTPPGDTAQLFAPGTASAQEYSAFVSRDGKYFFFMSTRLPTETELSSDTYSFDGLNRVFNNPENGNSDIYWINAGFIEKLRPEGF